MTIIERDELLDAVERVERELEGRDTLSTLVEALAHLAALAVRAWLGDVTIAGVKDG